MGHKSTLNPQQIAAAIDHTFLKGEADGASVQQQRAAIKQLATEATKWGAFAVCVRESMVVTTRQCLAALGSSCRIVSVIGFPLGDKYATNEIIDLFYQAKNDGAQEFDMVVKIKWIKEGRWDLFQKELFSISNAIGSHTLKIIFENTYLNLQEKKQAYEIAKTALEESWKYLQLRPQEAVRFFKTSTGFAKDISGRPLGATQEDVRLMASTAGTSIGIKAAGGVSTLSEAIGFWQCAGAPYLASTDGIDPMRFRIGSSSLLLDLFKTLH